MSSQIMKDWITAAGLRAVVVMNDAAHHCGYVGVPAGHPLHASDYNDPHPALQETETGSPQSPDLFFRVHGGLTYSGGLSDYPSTSDGLWWFGYDCAHYGDMPFGQTGPGGVFRDLDYCVIECESLAEQLAGFGPCTLEL